MEHQFSVPAPVDVVWRALLDPERVAPCMPGASLSGVDGSAFTGTVKVKLGPISLLYKGSGEFVETDEAARRIMIKASGKDSRGNGTAAATVTVTVSAAGGATSGTVLTDLSITGKPAQFGRGMIAEVGGKLLETFANNLAADLSRREAAPATAATQRETETAGEGDKGAAAPADEDRPRPAAPEAQPVDLLDYAGPSVAKRLAPLVAAVIAVVLLLRGLRRRRRRRGA